MFCTWDVGLVIDRGKIDENSIKARRRTRKKRWPTDDEWRRFLRWLINVDGQKEIGRKDEVSLTISKIKARKTFGRLVSPPHLSHIILFRGWWLFHLMLVVIFYFHLLRSIALSDGISSWSMMRLSRWYFLVLFVFNEDVKNKRCRINWEWTLSFFFFHYSGKKRIKMTDD